MRNILLLATAIALIIISCKEPPPENKTILADFTPMYRSPMVLNGKVKSFKTQTYWAKEVDGKIEKGDIITRTERDSLGYMSDFNIYLNEGGVPNKVEFIMKDGMKNHSELEIENNMIIGSKWFVNGTQRNYTKNEYDDSGNFIKQYGYRFGADTLLGVMTTNYFENGNPDIRTNFNYKNEITGTRKFIWKKKDYISEFQSFNREGDLIYSMKVEYDENDHFISAVYDYPGVRLTKYELKEINLDDMGNVISGVSYKNDVLFGITEYFIEYYQEK